MPTRQKTYIRRLKTFYGRTREKDAQKYAKSIEGKFHTVWIWAGITDGEPHCMVTAITVKDYLEKSMQELERGLQQ